PPVGTALGPHGVNIQDFCAKFNEATKDMSGDVVPAEITIYEDRTFTFRLKTPPASDLLRKAAGIEKGSKEPNKNKVGSITKEDLRRIAERKLVDLNAYNIEQAEKIIAGTARSMGIEITG
ncbi:MAG: 50S ribosomal protein L11, partial [Candidatus Colwellbacteria bacterium]|nr:50S ribosomal protein L11 [Candidatus Colwellbacteria bacterium]